jgi:hypothetical protein
VKAGDRRAYRDRAGNLYPGTVTTVNGPLVQIALDERPLAPITVPVAQTAELNP